MRISEAQFHICKIFIDETAIPLDGQNCFMYGALMLPIDCDLPVLLGKARKKANYVNCFHFAKYTKSHKETDLFVRGSLNAFLQSSASFRALIVNPTKWGETQSYKSRARIAGLLLSYPWVPCEGVIYKILSRPRIIFDRQSMNSMQEDLFKTSINSILIKGSKTNGGITKPIAEPSLCFSDKRVFDELQLVDLLLGITRCDYLAKANKQISNQRLIIRNQFMKNFPKISSLVEANRNRTGQKINIWHSNPKS